MRYAVVLVLTTPALLLAGCSDNKGAKEGPSAEPSHCTAVSAPQARQTLITAAGFSPSCAGIKAGKQFYFVNGEAKPHTATTKPGSPAMFDAHFTKKNETYAAVLKTKGVYTVEDKRSGKTMTLFVS